jgi:hypothetical protein
MTVIWVDKRPSVDPPMATWTRPSATVLVELPGVS